MRGALVIAEVALSVVLLAGAGLLIRRFVNLLRVNPGCDPAGVLTMDITRGKETSAEAARNFYDQVLERTQGLPAWNRQPCPRRCRWLVGFTASPSAGLSSRRK
jgi:hypothetical protein